MSSGYLLSTSPQRPRAESAGLHINPFKTRLPSTSEAPKHRQANGRKTSDSSLVTGAFLDDDDSVEEQSPLLGPGPLGQRKHEQLEDSRSFTLSVSTSLLENARRKGSSYWLQALKILLLFVITLLCCVTIVSTAEKDNIYHEIIATSAGQPTVFYSGNTCNCCPILELSLLGPFSTNQTLDLNNGSYLQINISSDNSSDSNWNLEVNRTALTLGDLTEFRHQFRCPCNEEYHQCNLTMKNSLDADVPVVFRVQPLSSQVDNEIIYAALILIFVYILIIFELVHRTVAAMLGALAALAVLSAINQRPNTETVIGWLEIETLMLLFGMMIIVAVLSETGIFDFFALKAYKLAKGKVWPLVTLLCFFSAIVSAFLDNVTTILLMAPVTIRLCGVLHLEPSVVLIAEVLFSNIGGTATAIGDPPNVIIVGALETEGITFTLFTAHLAIGIFFVTLGAYAFMRLYYRDMQHLSSPEPPEIAELNHEIETWRRAASHMVVVTREETLMKALFLQRVVELENLRNRTLHRTRKAQIIDQSEQLRQLEGEYQIKDGILLVKCGFVLLFVITFFFMYSFVAGIYIGLGWISVLGAIWLLVLADVSEIESVLHKVEWSTLLFFAALFILMEALAELRLMEWIGTQMRELILSVNEDQRLTAAVVIIVWISALTSSFIDNIPFTTAMIPVLKQLGDDKEVNLPLVPLVISLAYGACLGGNGTLIGASANVVCAGIAEQHGYPITFKKFFKVGFPMMLVTTLIATVYLLICHSAIKWNHA